MAEKSNEQKQSNFEVKLPEDKESKEAILNDFWEFIKYVWIKDKSGKLVVFADVVNVAQKKLFDRWLDDLEKGIPSRDIILKARRMGFSTAVQIWFYWRTTTQRNRTSVIIAQLRSTAKVILKMFKLMYRRMPKEFQPSIRNETSQLIEFGSKKGKGLNSSLSTGSARTVSIGRGDNVHYFHGSEVASWPDGQAIAEGVMEAVPDMADTIKCLESTAEGIGDYFHQTWEEAVKGESEFRPLFVGWHELVEYEKKPERDFAPYTNYEMELRDLFKKQGYPQDSWPRKIQWYRDKKRSLKERMPKEYPSTPEEAFITSGKQVFSLTHIRKYIEVSRTEPCAYYELDLDYGQVQPTLVDDSQMKVWFIPIEGRQYVIGGDIAGGTEEGNWSVAEVMDVETKTTVARYKAKIDYEQFTYEMMKLGYWYNKAMLAPEVNFEGNAVIKELKRAHYPNIYIRRGSDDLISESTSNKLGWRTTDKNRPTMILELDRAIRENRLIDYDNEFWEECLSFERRPSGKLRARKGCHDDMIFAKAICLQILGHIGNISSAEAREVYDRY